MWRTGLGLAQAAHAMRGFTHTLRPSLAHAHLSPFQCLAGWVCCAPVHAVCLHWLTLGMLFMHMMLLMGVLCGKASLCYDS